VKLVQNENFGALYNAYLVKMSEDNIANFLSYTYLSVQSSDTLGDALLTNISYEASEVLRDWGSTSEARAAAMRIRAGVRRAKTELENYFSMGKSYEEDFPWHAP